MGKGTRTTTKPFEIFMKLGGEEATPFGGPFSTVEGGVAKKKIFQMSRIRSNFPSRCNSDRETIKNDWDEKGPVGSSAIKNNYLLLHKIRKRWSINWATGLGGGGKVGNGRQKPHKKLRNNKQERRRRNQTLRSANQEKLKSDKLNTGGVETQKRYHLTS